MKPPWTLYPELSSAASADVAALIAYGDRWLRFFCALSEVEQAEYQRAHPEPAAWQGVYRAIGEDDDSDDDRDDNGEPTPAPRRPIGPDIAAALGWPRRPEGE